MDPNGAPYAKTVDLRFDDAPSQVELTPDADGRVRVERPPRDVAGLRIFTREYASRPVRAALEAGHTRIRPVLMTALAMIIGMLPMALGLGEGGEQNAPLGRAVIGGLLFATVATLFFVPSVFTIIHGRREARLQSESE